MADQKLKRVKFYLIRHGATEFNGVAGSPDLVRGWIDIPLSKVGKDEAAKTADHLADSGIKRLVCSDLLRTRQTAEAIAKTTRASIDATPGLRPWDLGKFTGQNFAHFADQMTSYAKNKPEQKVPGGESFNSFFHRAMNGILDALEGAEDGEVALVTHHRVERLYKAWVEAGEPPQPDLEWATFLKKGEKTGRAELLEANLPHLEKAARSKHERWEGLTSRGEMAL